MVEVEENPTLFNTKSKEINPYWIDPKQPLLVPEAPLHVKAHKLQILLQRLDYQAEKNGAQFNSSNYLAILNEYTKCVQMINEGKTAHDILDEEAVVGGGKPTRSSQVGDPDASSLDLGISADNPTAG